MAKTKYKLRPGEVLPLKYDEVFTQIFNNENNIDIVEEFIASYFNYDLKDVKGNITIHGRDLFRNTKEEADKKVDLLLKYHGDYINIEMSTSFGPTIMDRNILFASNIHSRQLESGFTDYNEIKKTIQINFVTGQYRNKLISSFYLMDPEDGFIVTKKIRFDLINMAVGEKMWYNISSYDERTQKIIKWCHIFMTSSQKELNEILSKMLSKEAQEKLMSNILQLSGQKDLVEGYVSMTKHEAEHKAMLEDIRKYREELDNEKATLVNQRQELESQQQELESQQQELESQQKELEIQQQEFDNKIKNKEHEKSIEIAKNMLKRNLSIKEISEITNLSIEEIENL